MNLTGVIAQSLDLNCQLSITQSKIKHVTSGIMTNKIVPDKQPTPKPPSTVRNRLYVFLLRHGRNKRPTDEANAVTVTINIPMPQTEMNLNESFIKWFDQF